MTVPGPELAPKSPAYEPERIGLADFVALVAHIAASRPPDAPEPGRLGPFAREHLRFRHSPTLAYTGADVLALEHLADPPRLPASRPLTLTATFLGLLGAASPLPAHFAAAAVDEDPDEAIFTDLCDIFHHRLYALLYRVLIRLDLLHALTGNERSAWATRLLGITGVHNAAPGQALDLARILLYRGRRGPRALLLILRLDLAPWLGDAALGLREAVHSAITCSDDERTALGRTSTTLGRDALLGTSFRVCAAVFAITIHHLDADGLAAFLPGAPASERLHAVVRNHVADAYDYTVEIHLRPGQRPTCQLGTHRLGARLGQATWLHGQESPVQPLILRRPR